MARLPLMGDVPVVFVEGRGSALTHVEIWQARLEEMEFEEALIVANAATRLQGQLPNAGPLSMAEIMVKLADLLKERWLKSPI